jgi:hypothetical protein
MNSVSNTFVSTELIIIQSVFINKTGLSCFKYMDCLIALFSDSPIENKKRICYYIDNDLGQSDVVYIVIYFPPQLQVTI